MDFHAAAEALINGAWHVIDPTGLAPRGRTLRITAERDSSDTAFLSTVGGSLSLKELQVTAVVNGELPEEDPATLVVIRLARGPPGR
jgi:transglutaminase-like putative cysteine protease